MPSQPDHLASTNVPHLNALGIAGIGDLIAHGQPAPSGDSTAVSECTALGSVDRRGSRPTSCRRRKNGRVGTWSDEIPERNRSTTHVVRHRSARFSHTQILLSQKHRAGRSSCGCGIPNRKCVARNRQQTSIDGIQDAPYGLASLDARFLDSLCHIHRPHGLPIGKSNFRQRRMDGNRVAGSLRLNHIWLGIRFGSLPTRIQPARCSPASVAATQFLPGSTARC